MNKNKIIEEQETELTFKAYCHIFKLWHEFALCGVPRSEQAIHTIPMYYYQIGKICESCGLEVCPKCFQLMNTLKSTW